MGDIEFRAWEDKLNHSHEVWKQHGYHEDSPTMVKVSKYLEAYGGNTWYLDAPGAVDDEDIPSNNIFFSTVNVLVSSLYARDAKVDVIATSKRSQDAARLQELLINHLIRSPKLRFAKEVNRVALDAVLLNFGFLQHTFIPGEEKQGDDGKLLDTFDAARSDFPGWRRRAPWDVRIDPISETFEPDVAGWFAVRTNMHMDDVRKNPGLIKRQDLVATRKLQSPTRYEDNFKDDENPDSHKLVELWTIYDKVNQEVFVMSPGSKKPLREPEPWQIPQWRSLPYSFLQFNPRPDTPMGTSYSKLVLPLQVELDKALHIISRLARRTRKTVLVGGSISDDEYKKFGDLGVHEAIRVDAENIGAAIGEVQTGGIPQELLLYVNFLIDQIRQMLGISDLERAQRVNVETAAEVGQLAAGAQAQRGRNQGPWEAFLSDATATFGLGLQHSLREDVAVPILGGEDARELFNAEGGDPFERVAPSRIKGDFLYKIRPGSTLPHDPNEQLRKEVALNEALEPFGELINLPQRAVETLRAAEKDPRKQLQSAEEQASQIASRGPKPEGAQQGQAGLSPGVVQLLRAEGA